MYLSVYQHLPYERLAEMFSDLLQIPVSTGAVVAMVSQAGSSPGIELFEDVIKDLICGSAVAHFDETGARVDGSLHWIHVASNRLYTLLTCHKKRGQDAIEQMGVLKNMTGTAVHDGFRTYRSYEVVHALCNAHHLRELEALTELVGQDFGFLAGKSAPDRQVRPENASDTAASDTAPTRSSRGESPVRSTTVEARPGQRPPSTTTATSSEKVAATSAAVSSGGSP